MPRIQLLVVQPTPFCNIDCRYCYLPDRTNKAVVAEATLASAFVARWCVGSKLETTGGVFQLRGPAGRAGRGWAASDAVTTLLPSWAASAGMKDARQTVMAMTHRGQGNPKCAFLNWLWPASCSRRPRV